VNPSAPDLLVLHALRIAGMADEAKVARRYALDPDLVEDLLLDHEAAGLVTRVGFAGLNGWALTERGKVHGERLAAAELDTTGARPVVNAVHDDFVPLNTRLLGAMSRWQVRPAVGDPMAAPPVRPSRASGTRELRTRYAVRAHPVRSSSVHEAQLDGWS